MLPALAIVAPGLLPFPVSRKPFQRQASAGECGVLAALFPALGFLSPSLKRLSPAPPRSRVFGRPATLSHLQRMAVGGTQRNRFLGPPPAGPAIARPSPRSKP